MSKTPLPCRMCGKTRDEVDFYKYHRHCISCETAEVKKCRTCGKEFPLKEFLQAGRPNRKDCLKCRYANNIEANRLNARKSHAKYRQLILDHYGRICACCGEFRQTMLELDHVDNDGAEHRKSLTEKWKNAWANKNIGGTHIYRWIVKNNYPDGFQILCSNCNKSKARNGGICEHKTELLEGATTISKESTAKRLEAPDIQMDDDIVCSV